MIKFSKAESLESSDVEVSFNYGNIYENENNRLKIGTNSKQVELLLELSDCLIPPYFILYVLVISRRGNELGRYQSPLFGTKNELKSFLVRFKTYLETDSRHHLWIGTIDNSGLLVYDQHNVIYAYGDLDKYIEVLKRSKYLEKAFSFPSPHVHHYHQENYIFEDEVIAALDWQVFPLDEEADLY